MLYTQRFCEIQFCTSGDNITGTSQIASWWKLESEDANVPLGRELLQGLENDKSTHTPHFVGAKANFEAPKLNFLKMTNRPIPPHFVGAKATFEAPKLIFLKMTNRPIPLHFVGAKATFEALKWSLLIVIVWLLTPSFMDAKAIFFMKLGKIMNFQEFVLETFAI